MQPAGPMARGIASLGRGKYISDSGLAAVLADVRELYNIPSPSSSRQALKRSRQEELKSDDLQGEVIRELEFHSEGKAHKITYIHPLSMLKHFCGTCPPFANMMRKALLKYPSLPTTPWNLVIYSDEVVPGNTLRHDNKRKLQTIYWSFQQFDHQNLSHDYLWFTLTTIRSNRVKDMGGMSVVLANVSQTFFTEPGGLHITGLNLSLGNEFFSVWAFISTMISDHDALKQALEMKGTSGLKICACCSNVVEFTAGLVEHDSTGRLIPSSELDISKFELHSDESVLAIARMLEAEEHSPNLKKLQTNLGFNLVKNGLILKQELFSVYKPISTLMFDWTHIFLVNGIWNAEVGALLHKLREHMAISHLHVHEFVKQFHWPDQFNQTARNVFEKRSSNKINASLSRSASEGLSVYGVIRLYLLSCVYDHADCTAELQQACRSYYLLCNVIDLLVSLARGKIVQAGQLHAAIHSHLVAFQSVYGLLLWIPKHHLALHLPWQLQHHGTLYSCFVHERKHKELKRYGTQLANTAGFYERHIIEHVMFVQTDVLRNADRYPDDLCFLVNPSPAPRSIYDMLAHSFDIEADDVSHAKVADIKSMKVSRGDLVVAAGVDHDTLVGFVLFHCASGGECFTCLQLLQPLGHNRFSLRDHTHMLLPTDCVNHVCTYSRMEDSVLVVPP